MSSTGLRPDLVFFNGRVITVSDRRPTATLVAVRRDRIVWVGDDGDVPEPSWGNARAIDCEGQTLVPGFIDAHCHLLAYAASLLAVDCGPSAVASIRDIEQALRRRSIDVPEGQWIRASGYDEFHLEERRHPSRRDLDEAAPNHPVRLDHRSGHACVLNSAGLAGAGISMDTPEPAGGTIERDWETGEPNGLLIEMNDHLEGLTAPLGESELRRGVELAGRRLLSLGVTSVQDATHTNSPESWEVLKRLKAGGSLAPRLTVMAGSDYLDDFVERGLRFGSGDAALDLGAAKIMLTMTDGTLRPSPVELLERVQRAHDAGFQVAIHAVEAEAVEAAADALLQARSRTPASPADGVSRDRIEHCSECPDRVLDRLAGSGVVVVTQPGFLYYSGRRYLSEVPEERQPWLYRIRSFVEAGLSPAASSDAPVAEPAPLVGIYAAVTRRAITGETIGESEGVSVAEALRMYTMGGAYASFQDRDKGSIEAGKLADLVLLDRDPTGVEPEQAPCIRATMTVIGGRVVWEA